MSNENKQNIENKANEIKEKTEFLDSSLIKGLIAGGGIYFVSFSVFSLFFGNAFGGFIATPLSAITFFLISRWDRLRESKDISFQELKDFFQLPKISIKVLVFSMIFIFFTQAVIGFLIGLFDNSDVEYKNYSDMLENIGGDDNLNLFKFAFILGVYFSYLLGGYFSAKLAISKTLSPYVHAILSSFCLTIFSILITFLINFVEVGGFDFPFNDNDTSVGANVVFFSQFILLPLIGAKMAIFISRIRETENAKKASENKKRNEEFEKIISLEIARLKPNETNKKKSVLNKSKKKTD